MWFPTDSEFQGTINVSELPTHILMLAVGAVPLPWKTTHWCSINTTSRIIIWSFPICKFIPAFLTSFKTSVHQHDNLAFTANCSILLLLHFFMDFCCPVWQVPMLYFHLLGFFFGSFPTYLFNINPSFTEFCLYFILSMSFFPPVLLFLFFPHTFTLLFLTSFHPWIICHFFTFEKEKKHSLFLLLNT